MGARNTTVIYFILLLFLTANAKGQTIRKCTLSISIRDSSTRKLLPSVIMILRKQSGTAKTFISENGDLTLSSLDTGRYNISFTKIGYLPLDTLIQLNDNKINVLTVYLRVTNTLLETVNVVAKKNLFTQDLDKIIYNVKDDPLSINNNLYSLMPKIPLVSIDASEQVQLKGSQSFVVLVNGKKSSLFNNDPTVGFKTLPASNIEKVEIFTIPPARFDSEGLTGVINIVTKKPIIGYTGNVNGDLATNNSDLGGQFNYKEGKVGLSLSAYGYDQYPPQVEQFLQRESFGSSNLKLKENGTALNRIRLGYTSFDFTLDIDSLNLLSLTASGNLRRTKQYKDYINEISGDILQSFNYQSYNILNDKSADVSLSYQRNFKNNKVKQFNFSYQYLKNQNQFTGNLQYLSRFNYSQPDSYSYNALASEKDLNQNFVNHQGIFGVYASIRYNKHNWGIKGGFRAEGTTISQKENSGILFEFNRGYFNIIPSLVVQRKLSADKNLSLGFTQRIQRPAIWQLNPFINKSNPNSYISGNTELMPVLNNVIEVNYRKIGNITFTIGGNYSFASNTIQRVTTYSSDSVSRSTYQNLGKNSNLGLNLSLNASFFEQLNLSLNTRIYYTRLLGNFEQQVIKNAGLQGNATLFANYRFSKTTSINSNFGFTSDAILLQGSTNAYVYQIINFNRQIPKINSSVSAGITNLFNKNRTLTGNINGNDFTQKSVDRINSQIFKLSINYQFGKQRGTVRKAKNIINNDDVNRGETN